MITWDALGWKSFYMKQNKKGHFTKPLASDIQAADSTGQLPEDVIPKKNGCPYSIQTHFERTASQSSPTLSFHFCLRICNPLPPSLLTLPTRPVTWEGNGGKGLRSSIFQVDTLPQSACVPVDPGRVLLLVSRGTASMTFLYIDLFLVTIACFRVIHFCFRISSQISRMSP